MLFDDFRTNYALVMGPASRRLCGTTAGGFGSNSRL